MDDDDTSNEDEFEGAATQEDLAFLKEVFRPSFEVKEKSSIEVVVGRSVKVKASTIIEFLWSTQKSECSSLAKSDKKKKEKEAPQSQRESHKCKASARLSLSSWHLVIWMRARKKRRAIRGGILLERCHLDFIDSII